MDKFNQVSSIPAYLSIVNVDTDMMIPKQFLKTIKRTGLGKSLFFCPINFLRKDKHIFLQILKNGEDKWLA